MLLIAPWDVDAMWPQAEPMLAKALARQHDLCAADIKNFCKNQLMQLWLIPGHHALVTQIQDKTLCRVCMIVLCGGKGLESKDEAMTALEAYARAMACDELRIEGRKGWGPVLGFEPMATVMRKKL